ncbi:molybdate ABC transporter substrate-binding protein [Sphaerisporangium krabiense]|uniref:Molybdate transport system substrate-binding protein n=1 Tax=Sphaerisporangium krabiense TaxID=763782 RepID=A0A7W8Z2H3_9ACTN|nr:molybdate ABC transporter substrate-binding protein [Sphaerisporangium krabiense]MBB5625963.1 molybdate transport system substrate-binding protein [Sphaerisporangium krabiense]
MSRWTVTLPLALALAALTGCGSGTPASSPAAASSGGGEATTLTVFAAASLTGAFTELGTRFEAAHPGTSVRFNFGSSATLAQQITQGAPADVFAAASPATMKTVTDASLAAAPATFVRNRLEIAVPAGDPAKVDDLKDLADPKVKVALCAPQVPCGAAALKALDAAGLKVTPVTLEQDVKATLTKVRLGEVDAALVYRTDVLAAGGEVKGIDFPEAGKAINDYPIAALTAAPAPGLAEQFVDLVLSPQGKDVLAKAGFETP